MLCRKEGGPKGRTVQDINYEITSTLAQMERLNTRAAALFQERRGLTYYDNGNPIFRYCPNCGKAPADLGGRECFCCRADFDQHQPFPA